MSSVGTSRGSPSASDMMEDYHTDSRLATPKSRPFKFAATPPKKKDFRDVASKSNKGPLLLTWINLSPGMDK